MVFDLSAIDYVRDWALPQFYFHIVAAYAILRHMCVPLGKADYASYMMRHLRPGTAPAASTGAFRTPALDPPAFADRQRVMSVKMLSFRVQSCGRRILKKKQLQ